ncbi:MAG TPA: PAS domain S-box protein [Thermoanaerobaculia bacterium]
MNAPPRTTRTPVTPLVAGAILLVVAAIVLTWIRHVTTRNLVATTENVEQTWQLTTELEETMSALTDAETGQRGYLLTGEQPYLEPYHAAISSIPEHLRKLDAFMTQNGSKPQELARFEKLVADKLDELALTVRLVAAGDAQAARRAVVSGVGRQLMDQIRHSAEAMEVQERMRLARRSALAREGAQRLAGISLIGAMSFGALLLSFFALVRRDYLGRARAEEEARASEEQLRTTLRSIGDGVLVTDAAGAVSFINPVAERLTGWTLADAMGRPIEEVFRIENEESRAIVDNPIRRVVREGAIVGLANHTVLIARDGRETPIADSGAPVRDARGRLTGVVLVFRDISEQRGAERSTQRLAAIISYAGYAMIAETLDNVITDWNPGAQAVFGFTAEEMVGRRLIDLGPADAPNLSATFTREILAGRRVAEYDARRRTKDGRWLEVAVSLSPIRAADGTIIGISRLVRDVTRRRKDEAELRRARQRAEDANAAKDRFLATLSHELRTPLTPVMASLHRLERRPDLGPGMADSLTMMRRNVELEARLIDDLLDLTRIARGKITLERSPLDLHEVLTSVAQNSRSEFFANDLNLEVRLAATNSFCEGDGARLQQVFWNLLKNSAKFTPSGGHVVLSSDNPAPDRVRVRVEDDGQGIRPDLLPRLFEPFEQGDTTLARRGGGLGLGLAIAHNLVELHDGSIAADSAGVGKGAAFTVELPTTALRPIQPPLPSVDEAVATARGRTAVLLVEDDADTGDALHFLVLEAGFDVRLAATSAAAQALFRDRPSDILVTDVGLPDGSGLALLAALKAINPRLQAIVLSGYGMEDDIQRSRSLGFAEHFVKPLNFNRLIAALDRLSPGG